MASIEKQTVAGFHLSALQRDQWLLDPLDRPHVVQCEVVIEGELQPSTLRAACDDVIDRHEILRTTFLRQPGFKVPFQVVHDELASCWREIDLRGRKAADQDAQVTQLLHDDRQPFDFESGPLLRLTLARIDDAHHRLLMSLPSLCADTSTLHNLVTEVRSHYCAAGDDLALSQPLQYVDYAEWQRDYLSNAGQQSEQAQSFWRERLANSRDLKLPLERTPVGHPPFDVRAVQLHLSAEMAAQAIGAAEQIDTTLSNFLQACFLAQLWRMTGESDIVIGNVCDGRTDDELQNAMGLFAKWLPVRCKVRAGGKISDLASHVERSIRDGSRWHDFFAWQDYFDQDSGTSGGAIGFEFSSAAREPAQHGPTFWVQSQHSFLQPFKLQLSITHTVEQGITAVFHYHPASYDDGQIARLAESFVTLVTSACCDNLPHEELDILSQSQREELAQFNDSVQAFDSSSCLHQLFEEQVRRTPQAEAVVYHEQRLTYAELNTRANSLAHQLQHLGVTVGHRVGLCVDRSIDAIVAMLAIMKSGGAYVALDPANPKKRLADMCADIGAPVIVTQQHHLEMLPAGHGELLCIDGDPDSWPDAANDNPQTEVTASDPAYVIFTSGSTGRPKGVVVLHRNLVNYVQFMGQRLQLAEHGPLHFATVSTLTADLGNTSIFTSLISGGCLHILDHDVATDGRQLADYFARHPVDVLKIVPTHFRALWQSRRADTNILPRKFLIFGGESLTYELAEEIAESGSSCQLLNHYGPTEATIGCLTASYAELQQHRGLAASAPIGRPIANTKVYVLDERLSLVPIGVAGELYVGGAGVAQGYLHRPELTTERFLANPFSDDPTDRMYKTGDLVRQLPDGQIEFLGRTDHQVKLHGYRVEPAEVEFVLERNTLVQQAVVLLREDAHGHAQLAAYVVGNRDADLSVELLRDYLSRELPHYMVPASFALLDELPITANGKIDRQALRKIEEVREQQPYAEPRTAIEETLADIWAQVLGTERVGIHDNFFTDLGGDSILSIQIIARAHQAGLNLRPRDIFDQQTIAKLAAIIERNEAHGAPQELATGEVPLVPIQHWFFEQQFADLHHWNQAVLLQLARPVNPGLLDSIVAKLVLHHDALRMRFHQRPAGWRQSYGNISDPVPFTCIDLTAVGDTAQASAIESAAAALQASLNLSAGPLLRVAYFDVGAHRPPRLLIAIHHLVVDGVSWRVILEDLQTAVSQLEEGRSVRLPAKTTTLQAWSQALSSYAESEALREQSQVWLAAANQHVQPLPVDFDRGADLVGTTGAVTSLLGREETAALLNEVPKVYQTQINDLLLTALVRGFSRWTGSQTLIVDMEGHGREEVVEGVDIWRTVGWFTTHYPVVLDISRTDGPGEALRRVKDCLRAIPHNGIDYGVLRYLHPESAFVDQFRSLPQPQVSFNYLGQLDQVLPESSPFTLAPESSGSAIGDRNHRSHLLSFIGSIAGNQLQIRCLYGGNIHRRSTISKLMVDVNRELRQIIRHCLSSDAGEVTPADFGMANLDEEKFDKISNLLDALDASEG